MNATAAQLREVVVPLGDLHVSIEPNTTTGAILDNHGEVAVVPQRGLMVRLDAKVSEQITLSKGTLWMIGVIPVVLAVLLSYGTSAMGWVREDQSKTLQIQQLQNDVNSIKEDVKAIKDSQNKTALDDAKKQGFQLGIAAGEPPKK